jgi:hypothetical protein
MVFFEVAKAQNWVSIVKLLPIQEEYNRIKVKLKTITKGSPKTKEKEVIEGRSLQNLNSRQGKNFGNFKRKGLGPSLGVKTGLSRSNQENSEKGF